MVKEMDVFKRLWTTHRQLFYYFAFICLSILSIYFVFISNNKLFVGDDLIFHMSRIEGLSYSIQENDFFSKINYYFLFSMGYASNLFYCIQQLFFVF